MRILELLEDRKGKLSPYKLSFLLGAVIFIGGWLSVTILNHNLPEIPNSVSLFLGVLASGQLGSSFLANKNSNSTIENKN